MDDERILLRHTLATLAYRAAGSLREAPEGFANFSLSSTLPGAAVRTPVQVLTHMCDLLDWSLAVASGAPVAHDPATLEWPLQVRRFFSALERFDAFLASTAELGATPARLFQGPIADALTHVGQLALLRRAFGAPIGGESFFAADIVTGRVGYDQAVPRR
jgi:hypothetical protein